MMFQGGVQQATPIYQHPQQVRQDISGNILMAVNNQIDQARNNNPGESVTFQIIAANVQQNLQRIVDDYWNRVGMSYGVTPQLISDFVSNLLLSMYNSYRQQNPQQVGYGQPQPVYQQQMYQQPQTNYTPNNPQQVVTYSTPGSQNSGRTAFDSLVQPVQPQPTYQQQSYQPPQQTYNTQTVNNGQTNYVEKMTVPAQQPVSNNAPIAIKSGPQSRAVTDLVIIPMGQSPFAYLTPKSETDTWNRARAEAYKRANEPRYALTEEDDQMLSNNPDENKYVTFTTEIVTETWKDPATNEDNKLTTEIVEAELKAPYSSDIVAINNLNASIGSVDQETPCFHVIEYNKAHVINSPHDIFVSSMRNVYSEAAPMFKSDGKPNIDGRLIVNVLSVIEGLQEPTRSFMTKLIIERFNTAAAVNLCKPAADFVSQPASFSFKNIAGIKKLLENTFFKDNDLANRGFGDEGEFYRAVATCFSSALIPLLDNSHRHFLSPRNDDDLQFILSDERIPVCIDGAPLRLSNPWKRWEDVALIATSEYQSIIDSSGNPSTPMIGNNYDKVTEATTIVDDYRNRVIEKCSAMTVFLERRKIICTNLIPREGFEEPDGLPMRCFLTAESGYRNVYLNLLKRTGPCQLYLAGQNEYGNHSASAIGISLGGYVSFWNAGALAKG